MNDSIVKNILQQLDEMSDEELIKALQEAPDYGIGELFEATGRDLDDLSEIPTVGQALQTGTGYELDALVETFKFKSVREKGATDSSFRIKLLVEYYERFWDLSRVEDSQ